MASEKNQPSRKGFKTVAAGQHRPQDPESLFLDLRRSSQVPHLWAHQADVLRTYASKHVKSGDVALELPTGTGKTLIGLLVGEYRRRAFDERVVYLCPTRQLASQVVEKAQQYGIDARLVLAPGYEDLNAYVLGSSVAVTTYSALFNIKPKLSQPQVIVLDDAHSAEDYISQLWSVRLSRKDHKEAYRHVIELLRPAMSKSLHASLLDDKGTGYSREAIDLLPLPSLWPHAFALRDLLDEHLETSDLRYSWSMVKDNLHACEVYVSWPEALIRPVIPPTLTHPPFAQAGQRIYMSATLGEGGELERITGVRQIDRLPVPRGWEKQSSGRRLFIFPDLSLQEKQVPGFLSYAIAQTDRCLVLTPSGAANEIFKSEVNTSGKEILGAKDIAESLEPFTSAPAAVLLLANRYDGIDLPDESCRLLVMFGLPAGANLQERFLLEKLGAISLLRDRLRTRFTQGVGRCTRNSADYAAIILAGQRLFDFCARKENLSGMHPQLQAEIKFGLENSKDADPERLVELVNLLFEQDEEWDEADREILRLRDAATKQTDPISATLMEVVSAEVDYVYAIWAKNWGLAVEKAIAVSDKLGGTAANPYRAWWYYLGGVACWLANEEKADSAMADKARSLFGRAASASKFVTWFSGLAREAKVPIAKEAFEDAPALEAIVNLVQNLGVYGTKFEARAAELQGLLGSDESTKFERGLKQLGEFCGFLAHRPDETAAPDGTWFRDDFVYLIFETKSDESKDGCVSLATVRQATTHSTWVKTHLKPATGTPLKTIVITHRTIIERNARENAGSLFVSSVTGVRELAAKLLGALRRYRSKASDERETNMALLTALLGEAHLLPHEIAAYFTSQRLADMKSADKVK